MIVMCPMLGEFNKCINDSELKEPSWSTLYKKESDLIKFAQTRTTFLCSHKRQDPLNLKRHCHLNSLRSSYVFELSRFFMRDSFTLNQDIFDYSKHDS